MSAPYDLDELPEAKRYAPQYRKPEDQACVDMHRRMIYGPYREEVMPPDEAIHRPKPDTRLLSATGASPLGRIATEVRTMPFGDVVAMAEGIGAKPGKLWDWAVKHE